MERWRDCWPVLTPLKSPLHPLGIDVGWLWRGFPASIARMASELCAGLGRTHTFTPDEVPLIEGTYVGQGFAVPSARCNAAVRPLVRLEGLFLDPIYTSKAFAGLPGLFAFGGRVLQEAE